MKSHRMPQGRAFAAKTLVTILLTGYAYRLLTGKEFDNVVEVSCELPSLLIVVLTAHRHLSLNRLLVSLSRADYGCARVDLQINVDLVKDAASSANCVSTARSHRWNHGKKHIYRRTSHAGLSRSWFEIPYVSGHEFVAIFEDDMQVSRYFYSFFSSLYKHGILFSDGVTAVCLHPNDWEVTVHRTCDDASYSSYLYLSPEPCNWGPIWKYKEWQKYVDWVVKTKSAGELPYVPEEIAYNFNLYLREGKDVQSSWVWRYNYDFNKRQLRYSFTKCTMAASEPYFAINHKEPGENFKKKLSLQSDPSLLEFDIDDIYSVIFALDESLVPLPFTRYEKGAKSLRG